MKKRIAGACAVALLAGGTTFAATSLTSDDAGADPKPKPKQGVIVEPMPKKVEPKPTQPKPPQRYVGPSVTQIDIAIQSIEIGWSETEVFGLMGEADWSEVQSTDFGYDVFLWYGDWAVETSDGYVTGVTWYG